LSSPPPFFLPSSFNEDLLEDAALRLIVGVDALLGGEIMIPGVDRLLEGGEIFEVDELFTLFEGAFFEVGDLGVLGEEETLTSDLESELDRDDEADDDLGMEFAEVVLGVVEVVLEVVEVILGLSLVVADDAVLNLDVDTDFAAVKAVDLGVEGDLLSADAELGFDLGGVELDRTFFGPSFPESTVLSLLKELSRVEALGVIILGVVIGVVAVLWPLSTGFDAGLGQLPLTDFEGRVAAVALRGTAFVENLEAVIDFTPVGCRPADISC